MSIFNTTPPIKAGPGINFDGETISTAAAPRNLLDNSDFRNPVNQRGSNSYSTTGYTIDRWYMYYDGATFTVNSDSVTLTGDSYFCWMMQRISNGSKYLGKTLTLAAERSDGTILCKSGVLTADSEINGEDIKVDYSQAINTLNFQIVALAGETLSFRWVALYEGDYTVDTLPKYQPKGYGAELLECQRYYYRSITGDTTYNGAVIRQAITDRRLINVEFPTSMRAVPNIKIYDPIHHQAGIVLNYITDEIFYNAFAAYTYTESFVPTVDGLVKGDAYYFCYEASADL